MASIRFGILVYPYQALDVIGPLDVLSGSNASILKAYEDWDLIPKDVHKRCLELDGQYDMRQLPPSDYLLLGGPMPDYKLPEEMITFIKGRVASGEIKTVFTTCTGSMVLAQTGLLDGKRAAVNHSAYPMAERF
ncbi:hypothetical protein PISL3812_09795 [Talaromyces islandicus]|uniref:DJ-1/PfpI domain-containing protein n=1 Tax=Talaromyces islandicus TaxID=28573 RepID=A0A0U1MB16_TALIS|nr:hypothetical protein PISL3812_09795 [Talaromyces islandicus]